jgi:hypothetical protein
MQQTMLRAAAERDIRWADMFARSLILLAAASCVSGPADDCATDDGGAPLADVSRHSDYRTIDDGVESLLEMMARLAAVPCPIPPMVLPPDRILWPECYGEVVAVAGGVVAIEMDDPSDWPHDCNHLVVMVFSIGDEHRGGSAVVVGRVGTTLICRFFADRAHLVGRPVVGDAASAEFSRTRCIEGAETFHARWSNGAAHLHDAD